MFKLIRRKWYRFLNWLIGQLAVAGATTELQALGAEREDDTSIIYVFRQPSHLILAAFTEAARVHQFPEPTDGWKNPLAIPTTLCGACSLRGHRGDELSRELARAHRDNLVRALSEVANESKFRKIFLVPVSLFAGSRQRFFSRAILDFAAFPWGELWIAFLLLFRRKSLKLNIGPIIRITSQQSGSELCHLLGRELYAHEKLEFGLPPTKATGSQVLAGTEQLLTALAAKRGADFEDTQNAARHYLDEIASRMSPYVVSFFKYTLVPVTNRIFSSIKVTGLEHFSAHGRCPVIILPNHRSHFDYLLISIALFLNRLPLPHIAAGNNLNFPPVGRLLRGSGAFFIRRKIDNDPLYKFVLERYLAYMVKRGEMLEFFIEGGRSRTGLLQPPKYGLLSYIIRCINDGGRRDAICLPVSIDYERVPEDLSLVRELAGVKKRRENFFQLLKSVKVAFRKFGAVNISVGAPLSVREALTTEDTRLLTKEFAQAIIASIQSLQRVTLSQVIATILAYSEKNRCHIEEVQRQATMILSTVSNQKSESLDAVISGTKSWPQALAELEELGLFTFSDNIVAVSPAYSPPEGAYLLEYYKNPILIAGLAHLEVLTSRGYSEEEIQLIRDLCYRFLRQPAARATDIKPEAAPLIEKLIAPQLYSLIEALNIWLEREPSSEMYDERYFVAATEAECAELLEQRLYQQALDGSSLPLQATLTARSAIDYLIDNGLLVTEAAEERDSSHIRFHLSEERRVEARELLQKLLTIFGRRIP